MQHVKKPPIVRLPPKTGVELLLVHSARVAMVVAGLIALVFALYAGRVLLAPLALSVVIGLMLGPVAVFLERRSVPPGLSALIVVVVFLLLLALVGAAIAAPLSFWLERGPQIWRQLQTRIVELREPLEVLEGLRDQLRAVTGETGLAVEIADGSPVESLAVTAPTLVGQTLLFLAGLYFFVATRHQMRVAALGLCVSRRLRWRVAHVFRDVERMVSTYLLAITAINAGLGVAVSAAMWLIGVESPLLWGVLAALLNYVIYVGPAIMAAILFAVGLATFDGFSASLVPPLVYLLINLIEAQFVTPMVIGRTLTMNPFIVLVALAFWLWTWGPLGGFIAVPALLVVYAVVGNIVPGIDWTARR
ncbi:MAG TPA: AI-2E family transporter [Rhizobiales bacterium]|nr:AI-2E family transporter [Hyphomicrobiales bacterium]